MSNFKGTKGKWKIRDEESTVIENTDGLVITETDYPNVDFDETKANALLISKAPEMLEELNETIVNLKILRNQIDFEARNGNSRFDGMDFLLDKWIERKEKLIKEATEI